MMQYENDDKEQLNNFFNLGQDPVEAYVSF